MEEKLAAYRAKKVKEGNNLLGFGESLISRVRGNRSNAASSSTPQPQSTSTSTISPSSNTLHHTPSRIECRSSANDSSVPYQEDEDNKGKDPLISPDGLPGRDVHGNNLLYLSIKFVLWCALFGLFICIGFGAVFVILSIFYLIYANMRSGREKAPGEKSAYSVFNPDCERIQGTLTAEQIEKGMLYGIGGAMR